MQREMYRRVKEWRLLFNDDELAIIDALDTDDTLGNFELLLKLMMGRLHRSLSESDSKDVTRLFESIRRTLEKIGELRGIEERDTDEDIITLIKERKKRSKHTHKLPDKIT